MPPGFDGRCRLAHQISIAARIARLGCTGGKRLSPAVRLALRWFGALQGLGADEAALLQGPLASEIGFGSLYCRFGGGQIGQGGAKCLLQIGRIELEQALVRRNALTGIDLFAHHAPTDLEGERRFDPRAQRGRELLAMCNQRLGADGMHLRR